MILSEVSGAELFWDLFTKIGMIVLFFAVIIFIGIRSRKKVKSVDGYVLGGRTVGPWLSAFSYGTAYFSAVIFVGYAGQFGWRFGIAATWIGIANALVGSLLAWAVLGRRTRRMSKKLDASTMPDFFGKRFSSSSLRIAAAVIIFIFLIPYTSSLFNGLGRLFESAFYIQFEWCILMMAVVTAIYVVLGGYMASVWNDLIQGIIMLLGIVVVIVAVLLSNGGITEALTSLSQVSADTGAAQGAYTSFFGADFYTLVMVMLLTSFGAWGMPQMVQKFYAIKSESVISKGMIISTIFALVIAGGSYFLGGFARLYAAPVGENGVIYDAIIPMMLENIPVIIIAVVIMLVMAASMSTLSSLVMASGSTVTLDLIKGNIKKDMTDKQQLISIRTLVGIFIVISAGIAIIQYNFNFSFIAQMMAVSWGALAGAFLAPYILGLYWKRVTKSASWACFGFAVVMSIISFIFMATGVGKSDIVQSNWFLFGIFGEPIYTGVWTMAISFPIAVITSLFTKPPAREFVDTLFENKENVSNISA